MGKGEGRLQRTNATSGFLKLAEKRQKLQLPRAGSCRDLQRGKCFRSLQCGFAAGTEIPPPTVNIGGGQRGLRATATAVEASVGSGLGARNGGEVSSARLWDSTARRGNAWRPWGSLAEHGGARGSPWGELWWLIAENRRLRFVSSLPVPGVCIKTNKPQGLHGLEASFRALSRADGSVPTGEEKIEASSRRGAARPRWLLEGLFVCGQASLWQESEAEASRGAVSVPGPRVPPVAAGGGWRASKGVPLVLGFVLLRLFSSVPLTHPRYLNEV